MSREWKPNWWELGNCKDTITPWVFDTPNRHLADPWKHARAICDGCPVKLECLNFVLEEEVHVNGHGGGSFAAGMTPGEIGQEKHRRMRAKRRAVGRR